MYRVTSDSTSLLRQGSSSDGGLRPRFRDEQRISFVQARGRPDLIHPAGQDSIFEFDLAEQQATEILKLPADVRGYAWSPDGNQLAYQVSIFVEAEGTTLRRSALCLLSSSMKPRVIRTFGDYLGTHASQNDEQIVSWSADGRAILVLDTYQSPSLYVLDLSGRDLLAPWEGRFGRWFPGDSSVLYREVDEAGRPGRWFTVDVASGERRALPMPAGTFRPAISPSGESIAFDDGDVDAPTVFAYDVLKRSTRRLVRGYGAPIWLSPSLVAAVKAGPCPSGTECGDWWMPLGKVIGIRSDSAQPRQLRLHTTLSEQRLFSTIDVAGTQTK